VLALAGLHFVGLVDGAFRHAEMRATLAAQSAEDGLLQARENGLLLAPPLIQKTITRTLAQSSEFTSNIVVYDRRGNVVASARPVSGAPIAAWPKLEKQGFFARLKSVADDSSEFALDAAPHAGFPYRVRVLFPSGHIRKSITPDLLDLALLCAVSLVIATVLAVVISRLVNRSLDRLGTRIDSIARGDIPGSPARDDQDLPELATLEQKLWWLGRQFNGAKTDVLQMRSNVEMMLRQLDEAIFVFGPDHRLQMAGEPAERLLARSRENLIGEPSTHVFPEWTGPGALLLRAFRSGERVREQPVTLDRSNLPPLHLLMTVEPVQYDDGSEHGFVVALRDADTRKNLRADLNTARRLSAISRITSGVAHEIKNPLNAIMLHLQIAQDKASRQADPSPELEIIRRELMRTDRVVNGLLDFHRPLEPTLAEHDLRTLAEDVAALIRPQAEAQGVKISVESKVPEAMIIGDADLLKQGLLNIAVNGVEAMSGKGSVLRFIVDHDGSEYSLSIEDNGPGIPPEIQDRIFNLYFTTKQKRGLGLAMTYRIVLLHSGTITVDSEVGKGTCFRIALPAGKPAYDSTGIPALV